MKARSEDSAAFPDYAGTSSDLTEGALGRLRRIWFILGATQVCAGIVALPVLTSNAMLDVYGYRDLLPFILSAIGILVVMGVASLLISFYLQKAKNNTWNIATIISLFYVAIGAAAIVTITQNWFVPILYPISFRSMGTLAYIAIGIVLLVLLSRKQVRKHFRVHYASRKKTIILACIFILIVAMPTVAIFYSYGYSRGVFAMQTTDYVNKDNFEPPLYILEDTNEWFMMADMLIPREECGTAVIDEKIYVVGGHDATGATTNSVEVYDIKTNTWSEVKALPLALDHPGVASHQGKLYVVGGLTGAVQGFRTLFIYDPVTNEWTRGPDMPTARGALAAEFVNGVLYAVGGWNGEPLRVNEAYDPATDTWVTKNPMPTARDHVASSVVDGKLYVIGGRHESLWRNLNVNEEYDPEKDEWSTKAPMPSYRGGLAAASLSDSIYVFGGENPLRTFQNNEQYIPSLDRWIIREHIPTARHGLASAAADGNIYVIGGSMNPGLSVVGKNEVFTPVDWRS